MEQIPVPSASAEPDLDAIFMSEVGGMQLGDRGKGCDREREHRERDREAKRKELLARTKAEAARALRKQEQHGRRN